MGQRFSQWYETRLFDGAMELFDSDSMRDLRRKVFENLRWEDSSETPKILEIGVGAGLNLPYYPEWVTELYSASLSPTFPPKAKRRAAERNLTIHHEQSRPVGLPYSDDTFDFVVATLILCSVDDRAAFVKEVHRVLKPGGKYLFMDHAWHTSESQTIASRVIAPLHRRVALGCRIGRTWDEKIYTSSGFRKEDLHVECENPKGFSWLVGKVFYGYAKKQQ
ncbi:Methyltransferase-like protein 7B [Cyanidiococcus yangmingshanensis]|uniref:Methyltransferase-like protein 7B n=1 Tax=Cyanidiococcus yangmingshanensis TaxID=2690220 RepID=A0A7J7INV0_9RHOD|nr:Methyltransferase-like protein 7B [Cyanidiococcus yangmingshanensis]